MRLGSAWKGDLKQSSNVSSSILPKLFSESILHLGFKTLINYVITVVLINTKFLVACKNTVSVQISKLSSKITVRFRKFVHFFHLIHIVVHFLNLVHSPSPRNLYRMNMTKCTALNYIEHDRVSNFVDKPS